MRKETKLLKDKAVNSLILSVEHFNRPWDVGRVEAVLMLLDHSFEMLLKATLLHRGGTIRERDAKNTIGFDACVRRGVSDAKVKFLNEEQALVLQAINGLRDAAQHHLVDISEGHLYVHARSGITLFRDLLREVFSQELNSLLPDRVLPVSTIAPLDPIILFEQEIEQVARLLAPGRRRHTEALARLRALAIVDGAIRGLKLQPSESQLRAIGSKISAGQGVHQIFSGIASVNFVSEGSGANFNLRLTKKEGIPVHLVPEGSPDTSVVAVKRVDELGFYNLGHKQLSEAVRLTTSKTTAAIRLLGLKGDADCYKRIVIGNSEFDRYSQRAINKIKTLVEDLGPDEIWRRYREAKAS